VKLTRPMSATETQLVDLARGALALAYSAERDDTKLSAMTRFAVLVKQLNLDQAGSAVPVKPERPARRAFAASDPRKILSAVK